MHGPDRPTLTRCTCLRGVRNAVVVYAGSRRSSYLSLQMQRIHQLFSCRWPPWLREYYLLKTILRRLCQGMMTQRPMRNSCAQHGPVSLHGLNGTIRRKVALSPDRIVGEVETPMPIENSIPKRSHQDWTTTPEHHIQAVGLLHQFVLHSLSSTTLRVNIVLRFAHQHVLCLLSLFLASLCIEIEMHA
jgi:hypothetical protein